MMSRPVREAHSAGIGSAHHERQDRVQAIAEGERRKDDHRLMGLAEIMAPYFEARPWICDKQSRQTGVHSPPGLVCISWVPMGRVAPGHNSRASAWRWQVPGCGATGGSAG